jgi:hypothetical protein
MFLPFLSFGVSPPACEQDKRLSNIVAIVQLKCPATGKAIDIFEYRSGMGITADSFSRPIPCPHCGENHTWTSGYRGQAIQALQRSPHASRVLVETEQDGFSATALP